MDNPKNLPLYQAIFDHYRKRIESGMLVPGDPLPSEAQLYGVSNITARRALNELKRQGLAVRERGRGSFVATPSAGKPSSEQMDRVMLIFPKDSHYTKAAEFIATLYTLLARGSCSARPSPSRSRASSCIRFPPWETSRRCC